jgi:hypothetical protein
VAWQYKEFVRLTCVGQVRQEALSAIESRIAGLRARGWQIPEDSVVEVRPSGFGYAASLLLADKVGRSYRLRRWVDTRMRSVSMRSVSGTQPVVGALEEERGLPNKTGSTGSSR